ncbi:MAG: metallophosphoesterase [Bacteroidales bacterium]|nr:metallophosphoesterase [Bacteroidales bacterium]
MRKFNLIFIVLISFSVSLFSQEKSGKLIILHTNDLHSNLTGFSPEIEYSPCVTGNDSTLAGFSRIAALIDIEKKKNPDNLLVLDAGDFLMGTFFHIYEADNGFQLQLMKKMGYDVVSLGNHEFDFGPGALTEIINANRGNGEIPLLTLANVEFDKKSKDDDSFENLYNNDVVKKYQIIKKDGLKIGVFGILGDDAKDVAPNVSPLKITNRIKTAKKIVKVLEKDEQVDFIICLSHSGIWKDKNGNWIGEDVDLAKKVKGIDVIISGHTHTTINDPIWIGEIPIVQTGSQGKNLGRFEINIVDGKINSAKYKLIPVNDDISGDCNIHKEIAGQIRIIDDRLLKPMGLGYYKPLAETDYDLVCDELGDLDSSNLGPLIADALHYYVNTESGESTDVAIIAAGVIRDKFRAGINGIQTVTDVFRVVSLGEGDDDIPGYPLAKV